MQLDIDAPCSLVMRMYSIVDGKAQLVQSSRPTYASKSFSFGYMFRPAEKEGRVASFTFCGPNEEVVKDPNFDLANEQPKPHLITKALAKDLFFSTALVAPSGTGVESVVFYLGRGSIPLGTKVNTTPLEDAAKFIGKGYVITAELKIQREQAVTPNGP